MNEAERRVRADGHPVVPVSQNFHAKLHRRLAQIGRFPMWTVYTPDTREYPGFWVARMWVARPTLRATRFVCTHDTLEGLRSILPPGMTMLPRRVADVPEIQEVWM